jgi:tripartite-type tricarboxylate transporter receptor subunit TctC
MPQTYFANALDRRRKSDYDACGSCFAGNVMLTSHGTAFVVAMMAGAALTLAAPRAAAQQPFPAKPIRIVVGVTPGGTADIIARLMGVKMSDNWGQPVVIENRLPVVVANTTVVKANPDGYTLLLASPAIAIRAALFSNLPYDTLKDFAGVTEVGFSNTVVVASPASGVKSVKELAAYANARPGKVFFATPAAGGADHMNVERFRLAAGIKAQHVAYKGPVESLIEVAAGRALFTATGLTAAMPLIKEGKLVALVQRVPGLPGVPLAAEVAPEWTRIGAQAMLAPAGTPLAIRRQLSVEIARILNLPDIKERLNAASFHVTTTTPEEHERNLRADIAAFAKVIKEIGLKPN